MCDQTKSIRSEMVRIINSNWAGSNFLMSSAFEMSEKVHILL